MDYCLNIEDLREEENGDMTPHPSKFILDFITFNRNKISTKEAS